MDAKEDRIGDMTRAELRRFVGEVVNEHFEVWYVPRVKTPLTQVLASMREHMIVPEVDEPSVVQMVIEERDRWNAGL